jgi:hypothetical protein
VTFYETSQRVGLAVSNRTTGAANNGIIAFVCRQSGIMLDVHQNPFPLGWEIIYAMSNSLIEVLNETR